MKVLEIQRPASLNDFGNGDKGIKKGGGGASCRMTINEARTEDGDVARTLVGNH